MNKINTRLLSYIEYLHSNENDAEKHLFIVRADLSFAILVIELTGENTKSTIS